VIGTRKTCALIAVAAAMAAAGIPQCASATQASDIPSVMRAEHMTVIDRIAVLAHRPAPVGPEAAKLLDMVKPQMLRHEDVLLPALTLLPMMAGPGSQDWKWALPLVDRIMAQQPLNYREEQKINRQMEVLAAAARAANDSAAIDVASKAAAILTEEDDVIQPTVLLASQHLRPKPYVGY